MATVSFEATIDEVVLYKFGNGALSSFRKINIISQVIELNVFESIFSPVIRAEIVVGDAIGLITNFPVSGEEIVKIVYTTARDEVRDELMIVERVEDITASDDNRFTSYILRCVSLEAWSNSRRNVQKAYKGTSVEMVRDIFNEFIKEPLSPITNDANIKPIIASGSDEDPFLFVVPNIKPFAAINMISKYAPTRGLDTFSYMFYQDKDAYHYKTLQDMFIEVRSGAARRAAFRNSYRYVSDELSHNEEYQNDSRLVTNLEFNRRLSTLNKIDLGYLQNKYFEINPAQKAYFVTERRADDIKYIEPNTLNTIQYKNLTPIENDEESANRVKYVVNNFRENDISTPIEGFRERWGRDVIAHIAMSQIDLTVTIPGDPKINAGELFHLDIPKIHGFNDNEEDDLISGFFLITEKRDTITQDGSFATSIRIQKDSYDTSIDKPSLYNPNSGRDIFIS
jgi:hypothetical protein